MDSYKNSVQPRNIQIYSGTTNKSKFSGQRGGEILGWCGCITNLIFNSSYQVHREFDSLWTERQMYNQTDGQSKRNDLHTVTRTEVKTDRGTNEQTDRRKTGIETNGQTERRKVRRTEGQMETDTQTDRWAYRYQWWGIRNDIQICISWLQKERRKVEHSQLFTKTLHFKRS